MTTVHDGQALAPTRRVWDEVRVGDDCGTLRTDLPFKRVILNAAVTWDYFPGHHDPSYAVAQGQKTIYVNTIFLQGLADRYTLAWAGPSAFILVRKLAMRQSIYAGDVGVVTGSVTDKDEHGRLRFVTLEISIGSERTPDCAGVTSTVWLPEPGQRYVDVAEEIAEVAAIRAGRD